LKKDINLLYSREDTYKREKWKIRMTKYLPGICAVLVLLVAFVVFKMVNLTDQRKIDELDLKLQETGEMAVVFENLEHQQKRMTFYESLLNELDDKGSSVTEAVSSVYSLLPAETKLIQVDVNDQLLKITGQTLNEDDIVGYASRLSEGKNLSQGQILSVKRIENNDHKALWEFAIMFMIGQDEGETAVE
jgi:Tfp pilus assembly protein PilN